jgi:hypothetical protein
MKTATLKMSKAGLCGLLAFGLIQAAHATNLVTDGTFTDATGVAGNEPNGQIGNFTTVVGWTASGGNNAGVGDIGYTFLYQPGTAYTSGAYGSAGEVYLWGPGGNGGSVNNGLDAPVPGGGNFVTGSGIYLVPSTLSQTITGLTVGDTYDVSFYYAGAQQCGWTGPTTNGWTVSLGGQTENSPALDTPSEGFTGWQLDTMAFAATNSTESLSFTAFGFPPSPDLEETSLLADVSLTQDPTPDAASTALLLGFSLLALISASRVAGQN